MGLQRFDAAREYLERALRVAESLRTDVQGQDLRSSYLASVHQYYELHVEVLMRLHKLRLMGGSPRRRSRPPSGRARGRCSTTWPRQGSIFATGSTPRC